MREAQVENKDHLKISFKPQFPEIDISACPKSLRDLHTGFINISAYKDLDVKIDKPNQLVELSLLTSKNAAAHNTLHYALVREKTGHLVVRRGLNFNLLLELLREFNKKHDTIYLSFTWIDLSSETKTLAFEFPVLCTAKTGKANDTPVWYALCDRVKSDGKRLLITVYSPDNAMIGQYNLSVEIKWGESSTSYSHATPMYLLLNPWNKSGNLYLPDEDDRTEYVLSDIGLIFKGSSNYVTPTFWKYNQFKKNLLECVLTLVCSKGNIKSEDWGDTLCVVKGISHAVKSMIESNWDGNYENGKPPHMWSGSAEIFFQWFSTKQRVKYGQCFVFAGALTTALRALGIPSRTTSCYNCALGADGTVNYCWSDSVGSRKIGNLVQLWTFHALNEVWLYRFDTVPVSDDWNAIYSNLGPAPLRAIRDSKLETPYNTKQFFNEISSVLVNWRNDPETGERVMISEDKNKIGRVIVTKAVNSMKSVDVAHDYKFTDCKKTSGSFGERRSKKRKSTGTEEVQPIKVIQYSFGRLKTVIFGDDIRLHCDVENIATSAMSISFTIQLCSTLYNGKEIDVVKSISDSILLAGSSSKTLDLICPLDEYQDHLKDEWHFKGYFVFVAQEPSCDCFEEQIFRVLAPELLMSVDPPFPSVDKHATVTLTLKNLTEVDFKGHFKFKEVDTMNETELPEQRLASNSSISGSFHILPDQVGVYSLHASFETVPSSSIPVYTWSILKITVK